MPRRIVCVSLPWLMAEHAQRAEGLTGTPAPFGVIDQVQGTQRLAGIGSVAAATGLSDGMSLSDARALCPGLVVRPAMPERLASFVDALCRWAERFSPLTGTAERNALVLDATGCAHLFGGEAAMLEAIVEALAEHGLTGHAAMADTKGAAWAIAHHAPARCTVIPTGETRRALAPLPVRALRLAEDAADGLGKVGLSTIEPLMRMPRGALARRFGIECMRRLDQAMGSEPEPVAPETPLPGFSARMTLPEPIGLLDDVMAGLERLLERVCAQLERHQMGARSLRLTARRVDSADQSTGISLARPGRDPMRLRALFERKVAEIEAGWGIDALRLVATEVEPLKPAQLTQAHRETEAAHLDDLISRLGNRIGFEKITRFLPAESHLPERAFTLAAAAYSAVEPWGDIAIARPPRPVSLEHPEPVTDETGNRPPARIRSDGRTLTVHRARGPERIAPEWWWDNPDWRSGPRDYWFVETEEGPRLWLFYTPASARPGWYRHGTFA